MTEPTLGSKNMPKPPVASPEVGVVYKDIIAKPLRPPNFLNLVPKNKNISLRWVNYSVGDKESKLRFNQCIAMGFVCVTPDEVVDVQGGICPSALVRDGRVVYGDLVLMKLPRTDYLGALKYNEQSAVGRIQKPGVALSGGHEAHQSKDSEGRDVPVPVSFPSKVQPYTPPKAEIDALTK